jgi:hypothetical protein
MEAIKALRVVQLHSYLVRECPRTLEELYDDFRKFNRSEVLYFYKLDQQRKNLKKNESTRPTKYTKSRGSLVSFNNVHKQIHNIDSDRCRPPKNWKKNFGPPQAENRNIAFDTGKDYDHHRGCYTSRGRCRE